MKKNLLFDFEKSVQAVNYFAGKTQNKSQNKLLIVKLMWAADRYHLRKYGRLVTGDTYFAMKNGPVASCVLNILDQDKTDHHLTTPKHVIYLNKYLNRTEQNKIEPTIDTDMDQFSETDIEAMEFALKHFLNKASLVDFTHEYPEWKRFEKLLTPSHRREQMHYLDFFEDPKPSKVPSDPFRMDAQLKACAKDDFEDYLSTYTILYS